MDTHLVVQAQHGDEEAFASLAVAAGDRLHAVAHRILRDSDLAEDATQQALLTIWRDLPQLRDPARFDAWSYRLLVRACYAEGRRTHQWAPNVRALPPSESTADSTSTVVDRDQLERGFRRLSIDHRAVVVLHHYLDLPLDEVADVLGVPIGTVRSRLHYAMRGLRAALEADARPDGAGGDPMSTERDTERIVRSWLEVGATALPDRVLDAVLDQLPATPQRRSWWPARRFRDMNVYAKFAIAAAAVVVIAIVGINLLPGNASVGGPGPTPTPSPIAVADCASPSPTVSPSAGIPEGPLAAGTYTTQPFSGDADSCAWGRQVCTESAADNSIRRHLHGPGWLGGDSAARSGGRSRTTRHPVGQASLFSRRPWWLYSHERWCKPANRRTAPISHGHDRRRVRRCARPASRPRRDRSCGRDAGRILREVPGAAGASEHRNDTRTTRRLVNARTTSCGSRGSTRRDPTTCGTSGSSTSTGSAWSVRSDTYPGTTAEVQAQLTAIVDSIQIDYR